jgi:carboxylesterase type B
LLLAELGQIGNAQSEDCLTVNIWTKPQTGERNKGNLTSPTAFFYNADPYIAVLLWIYGGGFATGSANNPAYVGKYFADNEDVIVVSFNYRVNVFGFPGLPGLPGVAQNAGLLDQRLAVEWVHENIEAFGGDPRRITIFGYVCYQQI